MKVNKCLISSNIINLKIKNESLEAKFREKQIHFVILFNHISLFVNFFLLLFFLFATFHYMTQVKRIDRCISLLPFVLILLFGEIVIGLLQRLYQTKYPFQNKCASTQYYIFSVLFIILRYVIVNFYSFDISYVVFLYYLDYLVKILIILYEMIDYDSFLISNVLIFITKKVVHYLIYKFNKQELAIYLIEDFNIIFNVMLSFWIMKKSRLLFYYITEISNQNDWYNNLLNNMNTGFITITEGRLTFVNKQFLIVAEKLGLVSEEETNDLEAVQKHLKKIMIHVFTRCKFSNGINNDDINKIDENYYYRTFEKIKNFFISNKNAVNGKIDYIGNVTVKEEHLDIFYVYELYCRYNNYEEKDTFEFIFNNVTRTTLLSEKNVEIRVKSAYLSKIAHEFKNPIICMNEIIDEEFSQTDKKDSISTIKTISNYLLILIKNIDFFTEMQWKLQTNTKEMKKPLILTQCSLKGLFDFITSITNYLIKKKKAERFLHFKIYNNTLQNYIETDEVKLKLLLINLISNSLKFTGKGQITLTVADEDDKFVRFSVKDTGSGIPDTIQKELFNPFSQVRQEKDKDNLYSTELGLIIAKDLASILGKGIKFYSKTGLGSEFWFNVSIGDANSLKQDKQSSTSIVALKDESFMFISHCKTSTINFKPVKSSLKPVLQDNLVILIVDDESLIRKSTIRTLKSYSKKLKLSISILEASDGLELLWICYEKYIKNEKIDIIISDETMLFYHGSKAAQELYNLCRIFGFDRPILFLSSTYSNSKLESKYVTGFFNKPLDEDDLNNIIFV